MPYEVKYNSKSNTIDSLTEENILVLNDFPVVVKEMPISYNTSVVNERLFTAIQKSKGVITANDNNSDDVSQKSFFPSTDSIAGIYYRVDASKGKKQFGLGISNNGIYYKHKKQTYYLTITTGNTRNKLLIFRVDKNKLSYVNQFAIPGNGFQNGIDKKRHYLKNPESAYLNLSNELPLTMLNTGHLLFPINIKEGNLKGIMSIDLNTFLSQYPYNEKVENKEAFVKVYGSRLDETKTTQQEYVQAIAPFDITKVWISTNTAKVIALDIRYPSHAFLYDMNSDTLPIIKEKRDALIDQLKESYDALYLNNKLPTGEQTFNYFSTTDWKQIKSTPANVKNYKKCASLLCKNNTKKCTYYPRIDMEKNKFVHEYLLKQLYAGKNKLQLLNPRDSANQKHQIQQAITVDENGDAYIVTNYEIAKFTYQQRAGQITQVWSKRYKNSFVKYPGSSNVFNGTAATVFSNYVAITDQGFPNVSLSVYNKTNGKLLSSQILFEGTYSRCDNDVVVHSSKAENDSTLHTLIISNNFGNAYPLDEVSYTQGGIEKYYFSENNSNSKQFEKLVADKKFNQTALSNLVYAKTATPLLNTMNNEVVYIYNQQQATMASNSYANWQLQAIDFATGNPIYNITPKVEKNAFTEYLDKKSRKKVSKNNYTQAIFNNIHGNMSQTPKGDFIVPVVRGFIYLPSQAK